ncbi:MAG: TIM barrel protein [Acidobacteriota bacterium]
MNPDEAPTHDFRSQWNRRDLLRLALLGAPGIASAVPMFSSKPIPSAPSKPVEVSLCFFSKPLQKLSYPELADFCNRLNIKGVDLTVRPGGHVEPAQVRKDLPAAAKAIRAANLTIPMITTGIVDAADPNTEPILATAAELGIRFFKLGYYYYKQFQNLPEQVSHTRKQVEAIARLCEKYKLQAGFHNHSGPYVGSPLWDLWQLLQGVPEQWIGSYFDPAHATLEGGAAGWKLGLNLLLSRIKMVAVKDYRWRRQSENERSVPEFGPLGRGEVVWKEVFSTLKAAPFSGPVSLHVEYTHLEDNSQKEQERLLTIAQRDLEFLRNQLKGAESSEG